LDLPGRTIIFLSGYLITYLYLVFERAGRWEEEDGREETGTFLQSEGFFSKRANKNRIGRNRQEPIQFTP
jgi:hypothetical protein